MKQLALKQKKNLKKVLLSIDVDVLKDIDRLVIETNAASRTDLINAILEKFVADNTGAK